MTRHSMIWIFEVSVYSTLIYNIGCTPDVIYDPQQIITLHFTAWNGYVKHKT